VGNEAAWWKDAGIDPIIAARKLWDISRRVNGQAAAPGPPIGETREQAVDLARPDNAARSASPANTPAGATGTTTLP